MANETLQQKQSSKMAVFCKFLAKLDKTEY